MANIKQKTIFDYWKNELLKNRNCYQSTGEFNFTEMGEDAQSYFKVETPNGDSDIEHKIFDWAVDFVELIEIHGLNDILNSNSYGQK